MTAIYIYWISTALLSLLYLVSAYLYITKGDWVRQALADLGYPAYLVPVMIVVKIFGVAAVLSRFSVALSDLAYAGLFYHLLLSALAHLGVRKSSGALPAAIGLVLLGASFMTQNAARETASPYAKAEIQRLSLDAASMISPSRKLAFTSPFPLTSTALRAANANLLRRRSAEASVTCILPGSPVCSILAATLTASLRSS